MQRTVTDRFTGMAPQVGPWDAVSAACRATKRGRFRGDGGKAGKTWGKKPGLGKKEKVMFTFGGVLTSHGASSEQTQTAASVPTVADEGREPPLDGQD